MGHRLRKEERRKREGGGGGGREEKKKDVGEERRENKPKDERAHRLFSLGKKALSLRHRGLRKPGLDD